jgi:hypothetical protein
LAVLAISHRPPARRHLIYALADRDPVGRRVGGHVALETQPVDGAVGALVLPVPGSRELRRQFGELELEVVDVLAELDQTGR